MTKESDPGRPPRLLYVVTHPVSADGLLRGQLAFMRERGFDVSVVSAPGPALDRVRTREGVATIALPMARPMRPRADAIALARLIAVMRANAPDIVNASTPKAGLLGMMAARALGVPVRIYLLRGLRLEGARGALRTILSATERIASGCASDVVCVSESLRCAAIDGGHLPAGKTTVLGRGSSNGVDPDRWTPTPERLAAGRAIAQAAGIDDRDDVIGFVGRFDPDKGISDLLGAFERVRARRPNARLLLIGGGYAGDLDPTLAERIRRSAGVVAAGDVDDLAPYYARMDVLAFPSLREGFPNVPLEAACALRPAVGYRSTGVIDAIVHGETGALVNAGDVAGLAEGLVRYLEDPELRRRHGAAARARAERDFDRARVWNAWNEYYRERLALRGVSRRAFPSGTT